MFTIKLDGGKTKQVEEKAFWHTTSHVMAQAIKRLYKNVKLAIGPAIDNGFYYDIDSEKSFNEEDLVKIEEEMRKIVKEGFNLECRVMNRLEAIAHYKKLEEPYKVEILEDLGDDVETVTLYKQGEFEDLCKGGHIDSVKPIKAIKLLSVSGAYWRGSEKNKMLQRIYGVSFPKASMLEEHMQKLEEAKERDHRRIGKEQELFMTHELIGAGLPIYMPNGAVIRRVLERYIVDKEVNSGYNHIYSPSVANIELYKTSGHWDHYKDDMFPEMKLDNESLVLRPMNCPHHMLVYKHKLRSYRDLPIKIGEMAHDFRYENSGAVVGLERVRQMCQNDAHIFVTKDQIQETFKEVVELILDVYKDFGIKDYTFRLSLRDKNNKEKYFDDDQMWETAENELREILKNLEVPFYEAEGEAAFYGPKLDVQINTAMGHDVTLSTCQLDFLLPQRFNLEYIAEDGSKQRPIVLHRAILGTIDRFMAFIIEEYKGRFPVWLAPTQVKILPISDEQKEYAEKIRLELEKENVRVAVDSRSEKIGYKIREARLEKVPYIIVVGKNEQENNEVSLRTRGKEESETISIQEMKTKMIQSITKKEIF